MKQAVILRRPQVVEIHVCRTIDCGRLCEGEFCHECETQIKYLDEWAARHARKRWHFGDIVCLLVTIGLMSAILWGLRGWFYELYQLWFGGN